MHQNVGHTPSTCTVQGSQLAESASSPSRECIKTSEMSGTRSGSTSEPKPHQRNVHSCSERSTDFQPPPRKQRRTANSKSSPTKQTSALPMSSAEASREPDRQPTKKKKTKNKAKRSFEAPPKAAEGPLPDFLSLDAAGFPPPGSAPPRPKVSKRDESQAHAGSVEPSQERETIRGAFTYPPLYPPQILNAPAGPSASHRPPLLLGPVGSMSRGPVILPSRNTPPTPLFDMRGSGWVPSPPVPHFPFGTRARGSPPYCYGPNNTPLPRTQIPFPQPHFIERVGPPHQPQTNISPPRSQLPPEQVNLGWHNPLSHHPQRQIQIPTLPSCPQAPPVSETQPEIRPSSSAASEPTRPVFPNPDTPDELIPPAHPSFHTKLDSASSNLSTRLSFTDVRGRPDQTKVVVKKINDRLDAIIDDLASTGKFVPDHVVKNFKDGLIWDARRARYNFSDRDIVVMEKFSKTHGRIAELIKMFCWMSPITTLYELEKALVSTERVTTFAELRIGPLLKHPAVAKFFQPPPDLREIPEITAHAIQKMLMKFLDKTRRVAGRGEKHSVQDFLDFFAKALSKPSPLHLCVRITSFPLAIQTNFAFRRMHRQSRERVQEKIDEEIKTVVTHEVEQVRRKLSHVSDPRSNAVATKQPTTLLTDIFTLFGAYLPGHHNARVSSFLQLVCQQEHVKRMFLLAIYVGAYGIERAAREVEEERSREAQDVTPQFTPHHQPEYFHRTHGEVLEIVLPLLKRQPFPISLSSLADIERAVVERFDAPSFHPLCRTSFLDFLVSDVHCETALGGSLTVGAAAIDGSGKKRAVGIVSQLRHTERNDKEVVSETLKLQCSVTTVDQLCCGSTEKLISDVAENADTNSTAASRVTYLTPLLMNGATSNDSRKQWSSPDVGPLGHKTRADAIACLSCAPLLEDLARWSHWDLVFRPQHGDLTEFIEKQGSELHVLEVSAGVLLRLDPQASHQKFLEAVEARDPVSTSGQLVSIVVQQGSVYEVSMKLLGSHVQTALDRMASDSTLAGSAGQDGGQVTQFVYSCLLRIPLKLCTFLAKEVFLEPLRRASSSAAVEGLLDCCRGDREGRRHLQSLGMVLGVKAWTDDFSTMLEETQKHQMAPKSKPQTSVHVVKASDTDEPPSTPDPQINDDEEVPTAPPPNAVQPSEAGDDTDQDQVGSTPVISTAAAETEREPECLAVIESIRSEDFGIGLQLEGRQKEVAHKQRQREGRGLQRLSKELYSKDTHFVLELIQNADDNSYNESLLSTGPVSVPALKFIIGPSSVTVLNNEVGFSERNIHAICDVGRSTKGAHQSGYIGQKGIGFKSVFRITDTPEIHSSGYHIRFDAKCDAIGYILPHWIEEDDREHAAVGKGWATTIVLPLKEDQVAGNLVRKFQDVRPSLLLFLHRLRSITVEDVGSGVMRFMHRSDGSEGIIRIEHDTDRGTVELDTWLVVRKRLNNASQFKAEVEVTEVALAFPLGADLKTVILAKDLQQQQVFAFLPLRSYGFRFIVQGDFDLPSSREDVNSDSVWNQFIRDEIPQLFLHALDKIMKLPGISVTEAVALYLQFIPLDGELHDFFKPVAIRIRNLLRGAACLPTEPGSEGVSDPFFIVQALSRPDTDDTTGQKPLWKQPSELVVAHNHFIRNVIPQSLLNSSLHYFYLSPELTQYLSPALQSHLGLHSLSIDHLITVAEAVLRSYSGASESVIMLSDDSDEDSPILISDDEDESSLQGRSTPATVIVRWVAQWLACVHIVLEDEGDRSPVTLGKLKKTKILPLTSGARVAAQDGSLFFPADGDSVSSAQFKALFDEIMVVDPQIFETHHGNHQSEVEEGEMGTVTGMVKTSHRVHGMLELLGVREIFPAEVIKHHILPCFRSDQWKTKSPAVLTTYMVYVKDSLGVQGSGVTEGEIVSLLRDCVALVTKKHGAIQPAKDVLHFSSQFQPTYDLEKLFPDVQWKLVSPKYLKSFTAQNAVALWRQFLLKLGVRDKIVVASLTETIPQGHERWQELRDFVGRSPDGAYTLRDYRCSEFEEIVRSVSDSHRRGATHQQMLDLLRLLDQLWDHEYRQFSFAKCYNGTNEGYVGGDQSLPSAFHRALKDLAWLPGVSLPSEKPYGKPDHLYRGRELFDRSKANRRLLDCHVPYVAGEIKNPQLLDVLQVRCTVGVEEMVGFLQEWAKAASAPGTQFMASIAHMTGVYLFLYQQSQQMYHDSRTGSSVVDMLSSSDQNPIFVPDVYDSNTPATEKVRGQFYSVHSVCWLDPSGVLYSKQKYNHKLPADLPKVLQLYYASGDSSSQDYSELQRAFKYFGVLEPPTAAAYIATLQFNSSLAPIPEKHHISDFTSIALHLSHVCMNGVISPQFLQQQLKGNKFFPSHRDLWVAPDVSPDTCLLENDNPELEKIFSECKGVHFLKWPVTLHKKAPRHRQIEEQQREEEKMHFIDVCCGIAKLSEVVETSVVPDKGIGMPLEDLRRRLNAMVPLLQRYLIANEVELYQSLMRENMKEKLKKMLIVSVLSLKCMYSIRHQGFFCTSPSQTSPGSDFLDSTEDSSAALYVVDSKVENPRVLVPTLVKIFSGKRGRFCNLDKFEALVKDMLLARVGDELENFESETTYVFGEVDADNVWVVPFQEEPEPSSEDEYNSCPSPEAGEEMDRNEKAPDSNALKSWPPKAPVSIGRSSKYPPRPPPPGCAEADIVGEDDIRKISEKYALGGKRGVARVPSRTEQAPGEIEGERLNQSREDREDVPVISLSRQSSAVAPRFDKQVSAGDTRDGSQQEEDRERQEEETRGGKQSDRRHQEEVGSEGIQDDTRQKTGSVHRNEGLPHGDAERSGGKSSGGERKERRWQESLGPDAALFGQGTFSVASALKPVPVESTEDLLNLSFLESCDQDSHERVGRWGEEYVYKFLSAASQLPGGEVIKSVTWINEATETGKPYDIEVLIEPQTLLYIEVKSTKSAEREFMQFSWKELQFADREKQNYHLYRVYSAGSECVTLKWMGNLASILTMHPVRLFLEL